MTLSFRSQDSSPYGAPINLCFTFIEKKSYKQCMEMSCKYEKVMIYSYFKPIKYLWILRWLKYFSYCY